MGITRKLENLVIPFPSNFIFAAFQNCWPAPGDRRWHVDAQDVHGDAVRVLVRGHVLVPVHLHWPSAWRPVCAAGYWDPWVVRRRSGPNRLPSGRSRALSSCPAG